MDEAYREHAAERAALGIPPRPLSAEQVADLAARLPETPGEGGERLLELLLQRVPPGVDPAAEVKAAFLADVASGRVAVPVLTPEAAVGYLGTMLGGYNVPFLVRFLDDTRLAPCAAEALKDTILVFENFDAVREMAERGNRFAREVLESWAGAEWFNRRDPLPGEIQLRVFRVEGEVNTDDLSPAPHAPTRPDIPLHARSMGETRFPGGIETIRAFREEGAEVAFVADVLGTGSSRKSATNSLLWHIGRDIPFVPNKRRGGVALAGRIAPIFFTTMEDAGGLPVQADVSGLATGDRIRFLPHEGRIEREDGSPLAPVRLEPRTLLNEVRAGGRVNLLIGRKLSARACEALGRDASTLFAEAAAPEAPEGRGYTLAQKLVGRACGRDGVLPGETCEPRMSTVGSQDTTGPMTRDELTELACLRFQADLVMQSFCHTAAYPTETDAAMHASLPDFITGRGGVALRPGDGIIHSWLNRLLLPDTVGTGGDSHTRFPLGISFPAGSGLVAFAAALGSMPLDMPESVLVRLEGDRRAGITLRDVVNAIPLAGIERGLIDRPGEGGRNVFNSRIQEIEGTEGLTVEQAFELSCASAERSAAAATVALSEARVAEYLRSNAALIRRLLDGGYADAEALRRRLAAMEAWLKSPSLLRRDASAAFHEEMTLDLAAIDEPVLACPNNPDSVRKLSALAGTPVDEVFLGSCMTNIGHFRMAARILEDAGGGLAVKRLWVTPPTRMDRDRLEAEGVLAVFHAAGARIEIPGCSLCMGNQARVDDDAVVVSTSTRNFDNRMGTGAKVYLASAVLAAFVAVTGRLPEPEAYFAAWERAIGDDEAELARPLDFSRDDAPASA